MILEQNTVQIDVSNAEFSSSQSARFYKKVRRLPENKASTRSFFGVSEKKENKFYSQPYLIIYFFI